MNIRKMMAISEDLNSYSTQQTNTINVGRTSKQKVQCKTRVKCKTFIDIQTHPSESIT